MVSEGKALESEGVQTAGASVAVSAGEAENCVLQVRDLAVRCL